ncbi:MAG TPA: hypothetical protein VK611_26900 [Acidimicrobiales bacterium]|nr:hypothetical protein [Acidimicrobiales bacterium]
MGRTVFGDPEAVTTHVVEGCAWGPRNEFEDNDLRETVVTQYWLFAPYGADIHPPDEVIIPKIVDDEGTSVVWQVRGEPARWESPWTRIEVGLALMLERAAG